MLDRVTVSQCTLKNPIHCSGVGVHSGQSVAMTLRPAAPDSGIIFRRTKLSQGSADVPALWSNAVITPLCTTIEAYGVRIATIEHLMAALYASGIDNVLIELDADEVPIMDGSSAPFLSLIASAGRVRQALTRKAIRILKEVRVEDPDRWASLSPSDKGLTIDLEIDFESRAIGNQVWSGAITEECFRHELAQARTFGFLQEVEMLRRMGFARGGSLENAIVIDDDRILNEGGLRYSDEFVRHKVLDSIGDLYLMGAPVIGHFTGVRTGHALNLRLLDEVLSDSEAWEWVELLTPTLVDAPMGASGQVLSRAVAGAA